MNRRLEAHKTRRRALIREPEVRFVVQRALEGRASEAAERVAARYAKAPSFSQVLEQQARAEARAAESAPRAAMAAAARAASESILVGLEGPPARERASRLVRPAAQRTSQMVAKDPSAIRWEEDLAARAEAAVQQTLHRPDGSSAVLGEERQPRTCPPHVEAAGRESNAVAQSTQVNVIEFPRVLVATRKIRPRLAEGPCAAERQLSIFEVDPGTISTEPEVAEGAPARQGAEWSGMELGAQPMEETAAEIAAVPAAPVLHLAPIGSRMLAAAVDCGLVLGVFVAAALELVHGKPLPAMREIELISAAALLALGGIYQVLCFTLSDTTVGMRCADVSLCTFDGQMPTRAQMRSRMVALLLSLLPLGLGIVWAIFDEDHLSWHDRLSGTYQRRE